MKIRIVGGPATGKVEVETDPSANFATIMVLAEGAVGKGSLHDKFTFYRCEIVNSKARAIAALAPTDSPQSVGLPASGAILMLKSKDGSPANTPRENTTGSSSPSGTPRPLQGASYRDRMIAIYQKYEPSKQGTVDATLDKYKGKEEAVIAKLVEKYGPEPVAVDSASSGVKTPGGAEAVTPRGEVAVKTIRDRVMVMYEKYQPAKVGTVDATLLKFKGKEEQVLKKLVDMYGPEPADTAPLASITPAAPDAPRPAEVGQPQAQRKKTPRERMIAIYEKYEPSKVGTVDATIQKFLGKEEAVIKKLVEKYGPEPMDPPPTAQPPQAPPAAKLPPAAPAPPPPPPTQPSQPVPPQAPAAKLPPPAAAPPPPVAPPPPQPSTAQPTPPQTPPAAPLPPQPLVSPATYRERMIAIYTAYEPSKLSTVDANLEKYKGKEEAVIKKLVEKYGPEPTGKAMADQAETQRSRGASVARTRAVSVAPAAAPKMPDGEDEEADVENTDPQPDSAPDQDTEEQTDDHIAAPSAPPPEQPSEQNATPTASMTPASPTASKDEEGPQSPASEQHSVSRAPDPRFISLVASALRRAWEEANHHTLRMRWQIWIRHTLEQKAEKLVAQGKWTVDPKDGEFECTEANPPYKTADLVAFLQRKQGTSRSQVLSDSMCDILRVVVRKSATLIDATTPPAIPVMFHDDDITAGLLNSSTIVALDQAKECQSQLIQLQSEHAAACGELATLRTAHADATQRLRVAEPSVGKLATLQASHSEALRELDGLRQRCNKQEEDIKHLTADLSRTQKELEMERRGLPTNMEVMLRQKDARLASLELELTKLRLKVRHQHSSEVQNAARIRELEADVNLLERSRSVVAISRKGQLGCSSSPSGAATNRSPNRKTISRSPDLLMPKTFSQSLRESPRGFSSMVSSARNQRTERSPPQVPPIAASLIGIRPADDSTDETLSYEPSARQSHHPADAIASSPQTSREIRELALRSEILEQELMRTPKMTEQMGNCPHCHTALTALKGSPVQSKQNSGMSLVAKRGFCFSCRRSFTVQDLAEYASAKSRRERSRN